MGSSTTDSAAAAASATGAAADPAAVAPPAVDPITAAGVIIRPVISDRWADLVALFEEGGEPRRCWCTYFRYPRKEFDALAAADRREAFSGVVASGAEPGLLAYDADGRAVGWVSVAPREEFLPHMERSRVVYPSDRQGVWSVLCFAVSRTARRRGVGHALLAAAVAYARDRGATALEGFPHDETRRRISSAEAFVGLGSMFRRAGFTEVERRGVRPLMRLELGS